jgi:hypothetical protein
MEQSASVAPRVQLTLARAFVGRRDRKNVPTILTVLAAREPAASSRGVPRMSRHPLTADQRPAIRTPLAEVGLRPRASAPTP